MKICVPTRNDDGLNARVFAHFGSAPFYLLVDTETGELELLKNRDRRHEHGRCSPVWLLTSREIDAVLCRGLGHRACASLEQAGITVLLCRERTAGEALAALRAGDVRRPTTDDLCSGHRHHHAGGHHD